jgi:hypothetical protein
MVVISKCCFEYVLRRVPGAVGHFAEMPGMALAAREVAPGLVDGKIIFRP